MNQNTCKIFKQRISKESSKLLDLLNNLKSKFLSYKMGDSP